MAAAIRISLWERGCHRIGKTFRKIISIRAVELINNWRNFYLAHPTRLISFRQRRMSESKRPAHLDPCRQTADDPTTR